MNNNYKHSLNFDEMCVPQRQKRVNGCRKIERVRTHFEVFSKLPSL